MPRRAALTLIEIVVVMAILVAIAALATPALLGVLKGQQLRSAAETLRIDWMRAHNTAMKTGRMQVFRYQVGGNQYKIAPWVAEDDALEAASQPVAVNGFAPPPGSVMSGGGDASAAKTDENGEPLEPGVTSRKLPEGTTFMAGDAKADTRSIRIIDAFQQANRNDAEWSRPILFYPDGTCSDAVVFLAGPRDESVQIDLRGMTGSATISDSMPLPAGSAKSAADAVPTP